jgi:hypothetical protein
MTGETSNLHPDLVATLTQLERRMGFELHLNSGHRTMEQNAAVGGVPKSEHTSSPAQGADVRCLSSATRYKMLRELLSMGVRRIGIGETFVHVGVAMDKPQDCIWTYYPTKPAVAPVTA